jgi:DNA-binding protein HU-beta
MNKKELIQTASTITNMAKKDVELVLTTVLETIITTVSKGEAVRLVGFGSFHLKTSSVQQHKNSTSNKPLNPIQIQVRTAKFSIGKFFREKVRITV